MKILHTADLHLGSPLTSRISPSAARTRRRELLSTFDKIIACARAERAGAVIIAGDLFDSKNVTKSIKERVYGAIECAPDITFIYTSGNHEADAIYGDKLPENLISLSGNGWSYFTLDNVCFAARDDIGQGMFDDYKASGEVNIAILHGELRQYAESAISPKEAAGRSLDYIALVHYHTYSAQKIDEKAIAVYSGAPHGRGFDELGEMGYVIIDTDNSPIRHRFVHLDGRKIFMREIDITDAKSTRQIEEKMRSVLFDVREQDLLKAVLIGKRTLDFKPDIPGIFDKLVNNYFHFELVDNTKVEIDVEAIKYDKTLKGEFIRLVMSAPELSDTDKGNIIDFGIRALMQETPDE